MLTKFDVRTNLGDLLSLELDNISDGLIIQDVAGLDPVKATLVSSSFAGLDGQQYQSSRRETRNITIQIGLDPDPILGTVRSLRKKLYAFFMPKSEVNLRFYNDDEPDLMDIVGRVESFETALFAQEPVVNISLICFDPDFYSPDSTLVTGMLTSAEDPTQIAYDGTVETGIEFVIAVDRTVTELTIYHNPPNGETRTLQFVAPLVAGDVLTISTVPGAKGATLNRTGVETSVLYGVSPQSNWIELLPGVNGIRVYAEGAGIPLTLEYTTKYGGM